MQIIQQRLNKSHLVVFFLAFGYFRIAWYGETTLSGFFSKTGISCDWDLWLLEAVIDAFQILSPCSLVLRDSKIWDYSIYIRQIWHTKVWSQSCKTHISSKMRNTNLKQKTEMFKQFSFKEKDKSIQWWLNSVKLKAGCQTNLRIFIWDRH